MQFVYYEPQANGWKLRSPATGMPKEEVFFRGSGYAMSVTAMTLSRNVKAIGPPLLPVVPVNGADDLAGFYEPDTISVYVHFFWRDQFDANVGFSKIRLSVNGQDIPVRSVYRLPNSSLESNKLVSMTQTITVPPESKQKDGRFVSYQLIFQWSGEKPDDFAVIIPVGTIRINGETIPATVIAFKKKATSKYQRFP